MARVPATGGHHCPQRGRKIEDQHPPRQPPGLVFAELEAQAHPRQLELTRPSLQWASAAPRWPKKTAQPQSPENTRDSGYSYITAGTVFRVASCGPTRRLGFSEGRAELDDPRVRLGQRVRRSLQPREHGCDGGGPLGMHRAALPDAHDAEVALRVQRVFVVVAELPAVRCEGLGEQLLGLRALALLLVDVAEVVYTM